MIGHCSVNVIIIVHSAPPNSASPHLQSNHPVFVLLLSISLSRQRGQEGQLDSEASVDLVQHLLPTVEDLEHVLARGRPLFVDQAVRSQSSSIPALYQRAWYRAGPLSLHSTEDEVLAGHVNEASLLAQGHLLKGGTNTTYKYSKDT